MRSLVLFFAITFLSTFSFAQERLNWAPLTQKVIAQGNSSETHAGIFVTVRHIENIAQNSYHARYYSAVGGYDSSGKFQAGHFELVSEKWVLNRDSNWDIDQWLFSLNLDGAPRLVRHYRMIQTIEGRVLRHDSLTIAPGEDVKFLKGLFDHWQKNL